MSYSKYLSSVMNLKIIGLIIVNFAVCNIAFANNAQDVLQNPIQSSNHIANQMQVAFNKAKSFSSIYEKELGEAISCDQDVKNGLRYCFEGLKNEGNAPYILLPSVSLKQTLPKGVIVLFHGLSDSPYFMSSIAEFLRGKGYIVIAPLTPGHGKVDASADMKDDDLQSRWNTHTDQVMKFADEMAETINIPVVVGGFSTGGAFATYFAINHPQKVKALLLFSGALELDGSAESMSNVWGIKSLAKWLDGEYETQGGHPFKYPSVASYSALVLMDIIYDIRSILKTKKVTMPIFSAHSLADTVTLYSGIENLTSQIEGDHRIFKIDESYELCHADLPMSAVQIVNLKFDKSKVNTNEKCTVPKANPLHNKMLLMLELFLNDNVTNPNSG